MTRRARAVGAVAGLAGLLLPASGLACSVCGGGPDRSRLAFLISTGFLSLLPLGMIAGGLLWLRRHARTALSGEFLDRDDAAVAAAASAARARHATVSGEAARPDLLAGAGAPVTP